MQKSWCWIDKVNQMVFNLKIWHKIADDETLLISGIGVFIRLLLVFYLTVQLSKDKRDCNGLIWFDYSH